MNPYKFFDAQEARYTSRIDDLNAELTIAESEQQELRQEREAILRDVMGSGDVSDLEIRIDAAAKRIGALKDRIHYMEQARIEQLSSLLNDVEDARAKAIKRLEAKHKDIVRNPPQDRVLK